MMVQILWLGFVGNSQQFMQSVNTMLQVFLRRTDGKGERILLNPELPIKLFHLNVGSLFKEQELEVFHKGKPIDPESHAGVGELGVQNGDIFHLRLLWAENSEKDDHIEVQVFYQGQIYSYKSYTPKSTIFQDIYTDIANRETEKVTDAEEQNNTFIPMIVYLGNRVNLTDLISMHGVRNGDLITLHKVPVLTSHQTTLSFLQEKCKTVQTVKVESITLATSDQAQDSQKIKIPLQCKELLRKSSMKSSHDSREPEQPFLHNSKLVESRSRSEGGNGKKQGPLEYQQGEEDEKNSSSQSLELHKNENIQQNIFQVKNKSAPQQLSEEINQIQEFSDRENQNQNAVEENIMITSGNCSDSNACEGLDLLNHCWLTNKKVIETYSVNCEEEDQNDVMLWLDCKISFQNQQKTNFVTFDCGEATTLWQVWQKMRQIEEKKNNRARKSSAYPKQTKPKLSCSNQLVLEKISDEDSWKTLSVLDLARDLQMQELPVIIFSLTSE